MIVRCFIALIAVLATCACVTARADERIVRDRLLVFTDGEGDEKPVRTPDDWRRRRQQIIAAMEDAMGPLPSRADLPPLDVQQHARVEGNGYVRWTVSFVVEAGGRLSTYLYVPSGIPAGERRPGMLALHPTHAIGKGVVAGLSTRPNRQYGVELARRGYVVIAPDYPSFGDHAWDFDADRYTSGTMKGVVNHMRCVDLLSERDDVDPERIGVIGHSLGGHNAMFVGAFDERLDVIVSSCGWTPFHDYYGGKIAGWTSARYMPKLRDVYALDPNRVPFDFYEVVAALAPRAFFSCSPIGDANFDYAGVEKAIPCAREVYELLGARDELIVRYPDCGHDFPAATRFESYKVIDRVLEHRPVSAPVAGRHVGVATVDITPPRGYRMSGYFHERLNEGTHDPLFARALWLADGEFAAALVFCDLIGVSLGVSREVRRRAAALAGVPAANILIAATHSHTGPLYSGALRRHFHDLATAKHGRDPHEAVDYPALLVDRLVDSILRARDLARAATLAGGVGEVRRLSFNRRFRMKDGTVRFNPGKKNPRIVGPVGPIDPQCGVLVVRGSEGEGPCAALTMFALHLDTVGGAQYSADYPLWLGRSLEAEFGAGPETFVSMFGLAPCGDLNHIDVSHDRPQRGQGEARRIGAALAETAAAAIRSSRALVGRFAAANRIIDAPMRQFTAEEIAWARRAIHQVGTRELSFLEQVRAYNIVAVAMRRDANAGHRDANSLPLEVQVFRLGDDAALVGLPGEAFVELSLAIRKRSPFGTTFVVELANDAPGYLPTRRAFAEGSYETVNSRILPGGGERLVDAAVELLERLR